LDRNVGNGRIRFSVEGGNEDVAERGDFVCEAFVKVRGANTASSVFSE
jgi:hypothetical protein